jgi:O-6-methylguanine DNA methyltransferase
VTTYQSVASALDCCSAQAIGQALKHNPYPVNIPCHRIVNKNLKIGGYYGDLPSLRERKRRLLMREGVVFIDQDQIAEVCFYAVEKACLAPFEQFESLVENERLNLY